MERYQPRLDGVRALAVVAVVLFHANILRGGSLGVDVFFVLSGYLITAMLWSEALRSGSIDIKTFLTRRARRLLPALAFVLTTYWMFAPFLWRHFLPARWIDVGAAALYLSNWREAFWPSWGPLAHTWSLSVEWQFYLAWPAVILGLRKLGERRALWALGVGWLILTASRNIVVSAGGDSVAYFATPLHATGLISGSAFAITPLRQPPVVGWAALLMLGILSLVPHVHETFWWQLPLSEIAAVALLSAPPLILALEPLPFLGRISYGVYLWHVPLWHGLWTFPEDLRRWILLPLSILLGAISFATVEAPFRRRSRHPSMQIGEPATSYIHR